MPPGVSPLLYPFEMETVVPGRILYVSVQIIRCPHHGDLMSWLVVSVTINDLVTAPAGRLVVRVNSLEGGVLQRGNFIGPSGPGCPSRHGKCSAYDRQETEIPGSFFEIESEIHFLIM